MRLAAGMFGFQFPDAALKQAPGLVSSSFSPHGEQYFTKTLSASRVKRACEQMQHIHGLLTSAYTPTSTVPLAA